MQLKHLCLHQNDLCLKKSLLPVESCTQIQCIARWVPCPNTSEMVILRYSLHVQSLIEVGMKQWQVLMHSYCFSLFNSLHKFGQLKKIVCQMFWVLCIHISSSEYLIVYWGLVTCSRLPHSMSHAKFLSLKSRGHGVINTLVRRRIRKV